ncbi:hypothetical protein [Vibrio parahaemolyticus]|uniref:hypothetical protein n=1 Tax=Vibrio parahaemolyticus TaxID=670 RepID=UPI00111DE2E5|nr:hypothetical protein [Vibrio parahaemolyticus]TOJ29443.1 hypothetical protein CGI43_07565 [Vibrio parahaemolyticus]
MIVEKYTNKTFTPLSDVPQSLHEIFNTKEDVYLTVTAGGGKSHAAREYAIEQVLEGKRVAFYLFSRKFQEEFAADLRKAIAKKKQSLRKFFKNQSRLDFEIVSGRDKSGCQYKSTRDKLSRLEATTHQSGLVTNWCSATKVDDKGNKYKEDLPWSFENEPVELTTEEASSLDPVDVITDEQYQALIENIPERCPEHDTCEWFNPTNSLGYIRIYTHAHLFGAKASNDDFVPDIVIVDEDVIGTAFQKIEYTKDSAKAVRDEFKRVELPCESLANIIELLADSVITSGWELKAFAEAHRNEIYKAQLDWWDYLKVPNNAGYLKKDLLFPELVRALIQLADPLKGNQNRGVYADGEGTFYHVYFKWPNIDYKPGDRIARGKDPQRLIVMDATGHIDVIKAIFRKPLVEHQINIKAPHAEVIQVSNISASDSAIRNNEKYRNGRQRYIDSVKGDDVVILSKKKEELAERYFGNQRGSNLYENCKELHIACNFNLPSNDVMDMTRCVYNWGDELSPERDNLMTKGRGISCKNYTYKDRRMRVIDSYLSDGELTQALHRARPIRRTEENPVKIVIHTNRVLDIDVTKTVSWNDLYGVSTKHQMIRRGVQMKYVNTVFNSVKSRGLAGIVIDRQNFVQHGFKASRWDKNIKTDKVAVSDQELVTVGFDVVRVTAKGSNGCSETYKVALLPNRDFRDVHIGKKTPVSMEMILQKPKFKNDTPVPKPKPEPITEEDANSLREFLDNNSTKVSSTSYVVDPSTVKW